MVTWLPLLLVLLFNACIAEDEPAITTLMNKAYTLNYIRDEIFINGINNNPDIQPLTNFSNLPMNDDNTMKKASVSEIDYDSQQNFKMSSPTSSLNSEENTDLIISFNMKFILTFEIQDKDDKKTENCIVENVEVELTFSNFIAVKVEVKIIPSNIKTRSYIIKDWVKKDDIILSIKTELNRILKKAIEDKPLLSSIILKKDGTEFTVEPKEISTYLTAENFLAKLWQVKIFKHAFGSTEKKELEIPKPKRTRKIPEPIYTKMKNSDSQYFIVSIYKVVFDQIITDSIESLINEKAKSYIPVTQYHLAFQGVEDIAYIDMEIEGSYEIKQIKKFYMSDPIVSLNLIMREKETKKELKKIYADLSLTYRVKISEGKITVTFDKLTTFNIELLDDYNYSVSEFFLRRLIKEVINNINLDELNLICDFCKKFESYEIKDKFYIQYHEKAQSTPNVDENQKLEKETVSITKIESGKDTSDM